MAVYDATIRDNGGAVFNFTSTDFGGATGNSGTANNTAWSALVAAIPASGGRIYIPQGTYAFNAQITLPGNVVVEGAGMDDTVLDFSAASTGGLLVSSSSVGVRSLTLKGPGAAAYDDTSRGISVSGASASAMVSGFSAVEVGITSGRATACG